MPASLGLALVFCLSCTLGTSVYLLLRRRFGPIELALVVLGGAVLALPLLVPGEARVVRFFAALQCSAIAFKMHDLFVHGSPLPPPKRFAEFLLNPTLLVARRFESEPEPGRGENLRRLALGVVKAGLGAFAFVALDRYARGLVPFAAEHVIKVLVVWGGLLGTVEVIVAAWRLGVGKARDQMQDIFRATTPADFWRRYNRMVGQYFQEDVFKRVGGFRAPVRATLVVFALSAVLHEYVFGMAIGAVQGYQTAFFLLQGAGVVLTLRVRPSGWRAAAWRAGTAAFNLATSVLFVASVNQIVPFWWAAPFE